MAEEPQVRTIRFAGKDIDAHKFVRLALSKVQLWMDYQMLQGDERTDFLNSFNNVLQGLVNGTYTTSEFGRISNLPYETRQYREKDGAYQEGEKKWYHSSRVGFDANANVETYLNGVADALDQITKTETNEVDKSNKNKKKWSKNTLYARIKNSIFGDGNDFNQTLLTAWADEYDPMGEDGVRSTSNRRNFLTEVIRQYLKEILGDLYDLSEEDKLKEAARIKGYLNNGVSNFELGLINPELLNYLFSGSTYLSNELRGKERLNALYKEYINTNEMENPIDLLDDYEGWENLNKLKLRRVLKDFQEVKGANISDQNLSIEQSIDYSSDQNTLELLNNLSIKQAMKILPNLENDENVKDPYRIFQSLIYSYIELRGKEYGGKKYVTDWSNGLLLEATKDANNPRKYNCVVKSISNAMQGSGVTQEFLLFLFKDYIDHNHIIIAKKGAVLKYKYGGDSDPEVDEGTIAINEEGTIDVKKPNDLTIPNMYTTGRTPKPEDVYSATDKMITNLENLKLARTLQGNRSVYNLGASVRGYYVTPDFNVVKSYTSKPLEDGKAAALTSLNLMGHAYASGTIDLAKALSGRLALYDKGLQTAFSYDAKNAEETNKTIAAEIDNSAKNSAARHTAGETNRKQDVALFNELKLLQATLENKNMEAITKNIEARQKGIGASALKNEERALANAYLNDPAVMAAYDRYVELYTKKYSGGEWTDANEKALTEASFSYLRALEEAKNWASLSRVQSINFPYATSSTIYHRRVANPLPR